MMRALDPVRKRYRRALFRRFVVRFHTSLILAGVTLVGLGLNRMWLGLGLEHLVWRSLFNCFVTWGVFIGAVRLWILFAQASSPELAVLSPNEASDVPPDSLEPHEPRPDGTLDAARGSLDLAQGLAEAAGAIGEADLVGVVLAGAALGLAGFIALASLLPWFWVEVPALVFEATFQVALSGSLVRRAGRLERAAAGPGWLSVLLGGTWVPMVLVTIFIVTLTTIAHFACGAPTRLAGCFLPVASP